MPIVEREHWDTFSPARMEELIAGAPPPAMGYLVWTRQSHGEEEVKENIEALRARRIGHIRTGISWAEWFHPEMRPWIRWYIGEYAKHFDVLPCFTFTPPELGIKPAVNAPPKDVRHYGKFVAEVLEELGGNFDTIELGNEWNLNTDWDPAIDPGHDVFIEMIAEGARAAKRFGKKVLLGGPSKVNLDVLEKVRLFRKRGLGKAVDILGFHNLRGTWSDRVAPPPLAAQADFLRDAWGAYGTPVWLTEYGFPPVDLEHGRWELDHLERIQVALFAYAVYACLAGKIGRCYWYTYKDEVHESLRFVTTGWEDRLQFHFGDTEEGGRTRLLGRVLAERGPLGVLRYAAREGLMPLVEHASLGRVLAA